MSCPQRVASLAVGTRVLSDAFVATAILFPPEPQFGRLALFRGGLLPPACRNRITLPVGRRIKQ
jgi:hypothetical protein